MHPTQASKGVPTDEQPDSPRQRIGRRNQVVLRGVDGPVLLFAHGFGCDQTLWHDVIAGFEQEYRVVLFDYVGSGRSDVTAYDAQRYASLAGYAEDILEICDAFALREVTLVAHSVSAMIGVHAALVRPEVFRQLVMIGPSPCYLNEGPSYNGGFSAEDLDGILEMMDRNFVGWTESFATVVMSNSERPELTNSLTQTFCANDPEIARQFAEVAFKADSRALLPSLDVPTAILHGAFDAIVPDSVAEYLHREIRGSTLQTIHSMGHMPHVSHPHETVAAIREALTGLALRGRQ